MWDVGKPQPHPKPHPKPHSKPHPKPHSKPHPKPHRAPVTPHCQDTASQPQLQPQFSPLCRGLVIFLQLNRLAGVDYSNELRFLILIDGWYFTLICEASAHLQSVSTRIGAGVLILIMIN